MQILNEIIMQERITDTNIKRKGPKCNDPDMWMIKQTGLISSDLHLLSINVSVVPMMTIMVLNFFGLELSVSDI